MFLIGFSKTQKILWSLYGLLFCFNMQLLFGMEQALTEQTQQAVAMGKNIASTWESKNITDLKLIEDQKNNKQISTVSFKLNGALPAWVLSSNAEVLSQTEDKQYILNLVIVKTICNSKNISTWADNIAKLDLKIKSTIHSAQSSLSNILEHLYKLSVLIECHTAYQDIESMGSKERFDSNIFQPQSQIVKKIIEKLPKSQQQPTIINDQKNEPLLNQNKSQVDIDELQDTITKQQAHLEVIKKEKQELPEKSILLQNELEKKIQEIEKVKKERDEFLGEKHLNLSNLNDEIKRLKSEVENKQQAYDILLAEKQKIDEANDDQVKKLNTKLQSLEGKLQVKEQELQKANEQHENVKNALLTDKKALDEKIEGFIQTVKQLNVDLEENRGQLKTMNEKLTLKDQTIQNLDDELKEKSKAFKTAEAQLSEYAQGESNNWKCFEEKTVRNHEATLKQKDIEMEKIMDENQRLKIELEKFKTPTQNEQKKIKKKINKSETVMQNDLKASWQTTTAIRLASLLGLLTVIHFSAKYGSYITKLQQDALNGLFSCLNYLDENTVLNLKALKGVSASEVGSK